jgi:photosystem II stability/assembly factor-like uncharacterized protein
MEKFQINHLLILFSIISCSCNKESNNPVCPNNSWYKDASFGSVTALYYLDGRMYAGTSNNGVFQSTDNGTSWFISNNGIQKLDSSYYPIVTTFMANGSSLFAGTYDGGVYRSTDNGNHWKVVGLGLTYTDVRTSIVCANKLFIGSSGGIYCSTNDGASWTESNSGLPSQTLVASFFVNGTFLFVGTNNGIFLSTNNGTSWVAVNSGLPILNNVVSSFAIIGNSLFAATQYRGMFRSKDNGNHWIAIDSGLTTNAIRCLCTSGDSLFAGTINSGIFLSINDGVNWVQFNTGFGEININSFIIYSLFISGSDLFAATEVGIWHHQL